MKMTQILLKSAVVLGVFLFGAAVLARGFAPQLSWGPAVLNGAVVGAGVLAALVVVVLARLALSQMLLRNGATDAAWFWFQSEPKGLAALRGKKSPS